MTDDRNINKIIFKEKHVNKRNTIASYLVAEIIDMNEILLDDTDKVNVTVTIDIIKRRVSNG